MLGKPQIPTPRNTQHPKDWGTLGTNFTQLTQDHQNTVRYLQQYLGQIYNAVVPSQFTVTNVSHNQSPYTVQATDSFIAASAGSAADTTINLPVATGSGRTLTVKKIDANAHNIVISGTIDGASSYSLTAQYQVVSLVDGANGDGTFQWFII